MTLTPEQLDELKRKHEAATPGWWSANLSPYSARFGLIDSDKWSVCTVHHDDDRRPCESEDGPASHVLGDIQSIVAFHNAFPALEQLARFGLMAKAYLEEHRGALNCELASEAGGCCLPHCEGMQKLLEASRALDGKERT